MIRLKIEQYHRNRADWQETQLEDNHINITVFELPVRQRVGDLTKKVKERKEQ